VRDRGLGKQAEWFRCLGREILHPKLSETVSSGLEVAEPPQHHGGVAPGNLDSNFTTNGDLRGTWRWNNIHTMTKRGLLEAPRDELLRLGRKATRGADDEGVEGELGQVRELLLGFGSLRIGVGLKMKAEVLAPALNSVGHGGTEMADSDIHRSALLLSIMDFEIRLWSDEIRTTRRSVKEAGLNLVV
jgi:hypothetical protein